MKTKSTAITSFVLGLFSWIPLLNTIIAPLGVYFGFKALEQIKKQPEVYSGKGYAIVGMIINAVATIATYTWLILKIIKYI